MSASRYPSSILTINLSAVAANWRLLQDRAGPGAQCAAVVKADAYGLGVDRVAPALWDAGCRSFFVALVDEALRLRKILPQAAIHVLNGLDPDAEAEYAQHRLVPVLGSLSEIKAYCSFARRRGKLLPAAIHIDTAMSRLGLPPSEVEALAASSDCLQNISLTYILSHLACADEPESPLNFEQLSCFSNAIKRLGLAVGAAGASLANSSGIFLGEQYHLDLLRPGSSLYGINPQPGEVNPMAQVVRLQGKILQVREIDSPKTVGYGATFQARGRTRLATVAAGYADGYLRSLSNKGSAFLGDVRVPIAGRVSMDLTIFDISQAPEEMAVPGGFIDLIGPANPVDSLAFDAGTIGYEILTALGSRYGRVYVDEKAPV